MKCCAATTECPKCDSHTGLNSGHGKKVPLRSTAPSGVYAELDKKNAVSGSVLVFHLIKRNAVCLRAPDSPQKLNLVDGSFRNYLSSACSVSTGLQRFTFVLRIFCTVLMLPSTTDEELAVSCTWFFVL